MQERTKSTTCAQAGRQARPYGWLAPCSTCCAYHTPHKRAHTPFCPEPIGDNLQRCGRQLPCFYAPALRLAAPLPSWSPMALLRLCSGWELRWRAPAALKERNFECTRGAPKFHSLLFFFFFFSFLPSSASIGNSGCSTVSRYSQPGMPHGLTCTCQKHYTPQQGAACCLHPLGVQGHSIRLKYLADKPCPGEVLQSQHSQACCEHAHALSTYTDLW